MNSEMIADFFARFSIQVDKEAIDESMESAKKGAEKVGLVAHHIEDVVKDIKRTVATFFWNRSGRESF